MKNPVSQSHHSSCVWERRRERSDEERGKSLCCLSKFGFPVVFLIFLRASVSFARSLLNEAPSFSLLVFVTYDSNAGLMSTRKTFASFSLSFPPLSTCDALSLLPLDVLNVVFVFVFVSLRRSLSLSLSQATPLLLSLRRSPTRLALVLNLMALCRFAFSLSSSFFFLFSSSSPSFSGSQDISPRISSHPSKGSHERAACEHMSMA